jgi:hypothetical protein
MLRREHEAQLDLRRKRIDITQPPQVPLQAHVRNEVRALFISNTSV